MSDADRIEPRPLLGYTGAAALPAPLQGREAFVDPVLWRRLTDAGSREEFVAAWLELQCSVLGNVNGAVVVLGAPDSGPFTPVASLPLDAPPPASLESIAEACMAERRGVLRTLKSHTDSTREAIACPIIVDEQICGVVALELTDTDRSGLRLAMRQLQWGCNWLETLVRRGTLSSRDQLIAVLDLAAAALENKHFMAAATTVVTRLATNLDCDRVSVGFRRGRHTRIAALSHSAEFEAKANLVRGLGAAMDEAQDQHMSVVYPPPPDGPACVSRAQAALARQSGAGAICSIPLVEDGKPIGGITLERPSGHPFTAGEVQLCEHIASVVGPILQGKRAESQWLVHKIGAALWGLVGKLVGPRYVGLKLSVLALCALTLFLIYAEGPYRVTADASLEGTIQRAVTAPISGYVATALVRAGDVVKAGQVLATLDDRDLALERVRWVSQKEQREREYSQALAAGDRARVRILGAQMEQAAARIKLIDAQLARTLMVAPFDGLIVTGDLSQVLSAPVERGDVLFEVAPLNSYRIILKVDERDIPDVEVAQTGTIALSGLPGKNLNMTVTKITPVSTPEDGRNFFSVEARLEDSPAALRPGMEGVAKIDIETRKYWWIYTHKMIHSLRMQLLNWLP